MTERVLAERVADFLDFRRSLAAGRTLPFTPQDLAHVYVKLDFDADHENARSADAARGFLSSVARASVAAHRLAEVYSGVLLEVQGSMLHVAMPNASANVRNYAARLHGVLRRVFDDSSGRVLGWRLAADGGRTLVVAGRGVHGDSSYVSLGRSANSPAKHIYTQLDLPEERRSLKRFVLATWNADAGAWAHTSLDSATSRLDGEEDIVREARTGHPRVEFSQALLAERAAVPFPAAGSPASPSPDRPYCYFGWVVRCDLDGFTARVDECFDDDAKLHELATEFYAIMDEAAKFVSRHPETLAQLPWAGDNFTVAALATTRDSYYQAAQAGVVEVPLDFDKELTSAAVRGGFGGWACTVAGGDVHGNANGNVFVGSIVIADRRFLVGVGEGFGRTVKAFSDIDPKPGELVVYEPDWARLVESYKEAFEPAITVRGEQSSLYRIAKSSSLVRMRARRAATGSSIIVTVAPAREKAVSPRPHYK